MFELGKQKKGVIPEFQFDIENDFKDPTKRKARQQQIATRVQQLKGMLRQGDNKELFDKTQTLMHGYLALKKVLERSQLKL
jgi:hypothetical protein